MLTLLLGALSLSTTPSSRAHRRQVLLGGAAATALPGVAVAQNLEPNYDFERVIPVATLTAQLATAPPRDIVITGANSGVGLAGAKILTAAGHRVICACRTQAKADMAAEACAMWASLHAIRAGGTASGAQCDLASLESVRRFAESRQGRPLDTLVLNAGISRGTQETVVQRTADGFEETIGVNHLGHFYLANLLVPSLAASPTKRPRLVLTGSPVHDPTSGGGSVGSTATLGLLSGLKSGSGFEMVDGGPYDPDKAYKDSKLCNLMFMAEASRRLAPSGITVNAFSPGLIADPGGFFRNQNPIFSTAFNAITKLVGVAESNEFGGSALAYMAVDPDLDGVTGGWYDSTPPGKHQLAKHAPSEEAQQQDKQKLLWEVSATCVACLTSRLMLHTLPI